MSGILEKKRSQQAIKIHANGDQRRTSKRNMSNRQGARATDNKAAGEESEQPYSKKVLHQREPRSDNSAVSERSTSEARAEKEIRQTEITEYVFAIRLPGVKITHCNFGKNRVEVWYTAEKTDGDKFQEELEKEIGSHVNPYKLKLVKKPSLPIFRYTSPGQSTSLKRTITDGSIGAYVSLRDAHSGESSLHALVSGHGKEPGDIIYLDRNPDKRIGEVKVAKKGLSKRPIASGRLNYERSNSYDIGLILMDEQLRDQHETSVTTNEFGRIQLARAEAAIHPLDMDVGQRVMLFNNDNRQGTVCDPVYNSDIHQKHRMIAIVQPPGEERQAVHGMNESGTLVVALPPYPEAGANLVKAVGMLVGIEEIETESVSLAVPIGTNLQELKGDEPDDYCANKEIQFA